MFGIGLRVDRERAALQLLALFDATPATQTNAPAPPTPTSASTQATVVSILGHMDANRAGLNSFKVPVAFAVTLHKFIAINLNLDGTRYFQIPDKEALVMHAVPAEAKAFQKIFAGLGTPETWPTHYDVSLVSLAPPDSTTMYELKGIPKHSGNVDHILLDVSQTTYEPLKARWFYKNGATIVMAIANAIAGDRYLLPKTETLDINFPSYNAHAVANYGAYSINTPIPASVWRQQKAH
jgi:hypothetical protein